MGLKKKTRRHFLGGFLSFLGAIFVAGVTYPIISYLLPPSQKGKKEIIKISKKEIPAGGMKRFHLQGIPAIAINSKGGYAAFSLVCTHLGCLVIWEGDKNRFLCPCHGGIFNEKGHVVSGPPPKALKSFQVEEKGDEIWIS